MTILPASSSNSRLTGHIVCKYLVNKVPAVSAKFIKLAARAKKVAALPEGQCLAIKANSGIIISCIKGEAKLVSISAIVRAPKPKTSCVVGLTTEPERLLDIRKNRMNNLKETENTDYTSLEKIKKEVEEAKKTFKKYKWPVIDITRKSVEETAAAVIKIHNIFKNNE